MKCLLNSEKKNVECNSILANSDVLIIFCGNFTTKRIKKKKVKRVAGRKKINNLFGDGDESMTR